MSNGRLATVVQGMAEIGRSLRQDGWRATLSGIGGRRDKARHVKFCPSLQLDRETLAGVYRDSWLVRRIITAVPEEGLRRGFGEELDSDELPEFTRLNFERYPGEGALVRACNLARLMGGSGIYLGFADGGADLTQPAREGAEVSFLEVFHRYELQAVEGSRVQDPSDPRYGRPDLWEVIGQNRTNLRFHHSRMIVFPGQPRADQFEVGGLDRDWDDSILQAMWEDVARYGLFWQSVSHLMQISSVGVLKIDGLIQMLTSQDQADAEARIDLINEALSLTRLMMLDASKNEEYHRESVSFTDVPSLLQELQLATAAAVGMPVTVLFGRSPAGMNATGESDMRLWYDKVDVWRERVLKPRAEQLIGACERKDITIEWPPLWEPTEKECAEVRNLKLQGDHILWQDGVLTEDEWRRALHEGKRVEEMMSGPAPEPEPLALPPGEAPDPEDPEPGAPSPVDRARALLRDERQDASDPDPQVKSARERLAGLVDTYGRFSEQAKAARAAIEAFEAANGKRGRAARAAAAAKAEKVRLARIEANAHEFGTPEREAADAAREKAEEEAEAELDKQERALKAEAKLAERGLNKAEREIERGIDDVEAAHQSVLDRAQDELEALEAEAPATPDVEERMAPHDAKLAEAESAAERAADEYEAFDPRAESDAAYERAAVIAADVDRSEQNLPEVDGEPDVQQRLALHKHEKLKASHQAELAKAERLESEGLAKDAQLKVTRDETAKALEGARTEHAAARASLEAEASGMGASNTKLAKAKAAVSEAEAELEEFKALSSADLVRTPDGYAAKGAEERAKALQQGPRGGRYYISEKGGSKVYVR